MKTYKNLASVIRSVVTEAHKKDDPPFEPDEKSSFKKANNKNRTGMDVARALARRAMQKKMKESFDLDISEEEADDLLESIQQIGEEVEQMDEDELDEKYRRGGNPGPTTRQRAAILNKMKPLDPNATVIHKDGRYSSSKGWPHRDQLKDHIHKESGHKVMIPATTNDMHDAVTGDKIATDVYSGKHTAKSLVRAVKKFHKE